MDVYCKLQPTRMFAWILIPSKDILIGYATRWTRQKQPYQLNCLSWIPMFDVCTTTTSTQFRKFSFVASLFAIWNNLTTHCSYSSSFDGDQFLLFYRQGQKLQVKVLVPSDGCIYSLERRDAPNTDHFYCNFHHRYYLLIINTDQFQGQDLDWDGEEDSMPFANQSKRHGIHGS